MKKKRKKKNLSNLTLFRMTWPNLWRTAPWYVILSTLLGVVFSLIGAAQTLLNQNLFDRGGVCNRRCRVAPLFVCAFVDDCDPCCAKGTRNRKYFPQYAF